MTFAHSASSQPFPDETLAYCAGLFDGEGCVNFSVGGPSKTVVLRVMIRNTDLPVISYVQSLFGGRIETRKEYPGKPHWKPSHCWRVDWDAAMAFLLAIEPWVRIKSEQIFVARMWDAVRSRGTAPQRGPEYRDMIGLLVRQLQWLNRKGRRIVADVEPIQACLATLPVPVDQILAEVGICR
jgi:hypothetical protein